MKKTYSIGYLYDDSFGRTHYGGLSAESEQEFLIKFIELIYSKEIRVHSASTNIYNHEALDHHYNKNIEYFEELKKGMDLK